MVEWTEYLGTKMPCVRARLVGLTPIMMSNPASMSEPKPAGPVTRTRAALDPQEEAERAAYRADDGRLYMPAVALRSSILKASVGYKVQKETAKRYLSDLMVLPEDRMYLERASSPVEDFIVDRRRAVNKQKGGIIVSRPLIDLPWEIPVVLAWYKGEGNERAEDNNQFIHILLQTAERAGRQIGVGAFRPDCGGWFGRYRLGLEAA